MNRSGSGAIRLLLTALSVLLLATACSPAGGPRAPTAVSAHAGPDWAQVHFRQPLAAGAQVGVQYRQAGSSDTDWHNAVDAVFPDGGGVALVPWPELDQLEFRVGLETDGLWLWSESSQQVSRPAGVTLHVGTFNRGYQPETAGTVFLVLLDLPAEVSGSLDLFLSGPPGWAPDQPADGFAISVDQRDLDAGYLVQYFYGLNVIPGSYQLRAEQYTGGSWEHRTEVTDTAFRLPPATALRAEVSGPGAVQANWRPPVSGAHTNVSIHAPDFSLSDYPATTATGWNFTDLPLAAGPLRLEVTTTNWVPGQAGPVLLPVPFGASNARAEFSLAN